MKINEIYYQNSGRETMYKSIFWSNFSHAMYIKAFIKGRKQNEVQSKGDKNNRSLNPKNEF